MLYLRLVNQHLSSARLLLAELSGHDNPGASLQRALEQSVLHLLNSAYLCQLRAIADNYHCPDIVTLSDIQALLAALAVNDSPAPEAAEILALSNESWLGEMLNTWRELCLPMPAQAYTESGATVSQSEISVREDSRELIVDAEKLGYWLEALDELAQRHNEMMTEY
ncbi:MAG: hypothetical protein COA75_04985 [Cellvibrionales bacterium]|nr:MAG: hypothetical protein COA75_04985 [Cellvibrionales bacterium]